MNAPSALRPALLEMLHDLDRQTLHVSLVPAPEQRHCGHCVRVVWCHNPGWYRELCGMFPRNRRRRGDRYTDSRVKRDDVRAVIERLLDGRGTRSAYATILLQIALGRMHDEALRKDADVERELSVVFGMAHEPQTPLSASGW